MSYRFKKPDPSSFKQCEKEAITGKANMILTFLPKKGNEKVYLRALRVLSGKKAFGHLNVSESLMRME